MVTPLWHEHSITKNFRGENCSDKRTSHKNAGTETNRAPAKISSKINFEFMSEICIIPTHFRERRDFFKSEVDLKAKWVVQAAADNAGKNLSSFSSSGQVHKVCAVTCVCVHVCVCVCVCMYLSIYLSMCVVCACMCEYTSMLCGWLNHP